MANYSLVINSRFTPFTYQEMLAPVLMATQAHQELENQYGELATKASVWEEMANEQTDPHAYKMYKTYADDLEKQAGQLAREGLNATSRRDMLNMRARYAKEITPIEQAYNTRQRQAEQQQQALLQNPTLMLSRRAATTSLDKYIENPNLDYESYSGALLTQQVGQAAAAIAKELRNYGKGKPLDGFTRTWLQQHGYTAGEVALAINNPNDPKSSKVLNTIVNNVIADSGISKWADDKTLNQAYSYARQGLWQAVGQTQVGSYTDQAAVMRAQEAMQRRAEARARRAAREAARQQGKGFALNPTNIYSQRELNEAEKKYKNSVKNFSQYFTRDKEGRMKLTVAGRKEYFKPYYISDPTDPGRSYITSAGVMRTVGGKKIKIHSPFRQFVDNELGGAKYMGKSLTDGSMRPGMLGNAWVRYTNESPAAKTAKYDAQKDTEYTIFLPQTDEYQKGFKGKLQGIAGSIGALVEVDYDPKTHKWVTTGNTLSLSDFYGDDYKIISRNPSTISNSKGNMTTWKIAKEGENAKRYMSIPGIHRSAEAGRNEAAISMWQTQQLLQDPNLSQSARTRLENAYDDWTQQLYMFDMQLDVGNKASDQSVSPYYIP